MRIQLWYCVFMWYEVMRIQGVDIEFCMAFVVIADTEIGSNCLYFESDMVFVFLIF